MRSAGARIVFGRFLGLDLTNGITNLLIRGELERQRQREGNPSLTRSDFLSSRPDIIQEIYPEFARGMFAANQLLRSFPSAVVGGSVQPTAYRFMEKYGLWPGDT